MCFIIKINQRSRSCDFSSEVSELDHASCLMPSCYLVIVIVSYLMMSGPLAPCCALQLKFMWGNLAVGSGDRWREVSVPFLQPGQVRQDSGPQI